MVEIEEVKKQVIKIGKDTLVRVYIESEKSATILIKDTDEFNIDFKDLETLKYFYNKICREIRSYGQRQQPREKGRFIKAKEEKIGEVGRPKKVDEKEVTDKIIKLNRNGNSSREISKILLEENGINIHFNTILNIIENIEREKLLEELK